MKLVEYSGNIGWKVHELAWNLHEIGFALIWSHLAKGVIYSSIYASFKIQYIILLYKAIG